MKRILVLMLLLTTPIMAGDLMPPLMPPLMGGNSMEEQMRQSDQAAQENELWALRGEVAERDEEHAKLVRVVAVGRRLESENRELRQQNAQLRAALNDCRQKAQQTQQQVDASEAQASGYAKQNPSAEFQRQMEAQRRYEEEHSR